MTAYYDNYYDGKRGWEHTSPGWYEIVIKTKNSDQHDKLLNWLNENIDKPERHVRWKKSLYESHFKFRYERDYLWFRLTWE